MYFRWLPFEIFEVVYTCQINLGKHAKSRSSSVTHLIKLSQYSLLCDNTFLLSAPVTNLDMQNQSEIIVFGFENSMFSLDGVALNGLYKIHEEQMCSFVCVCVCVWCAGSMSYKILSLIMFTMLSPFSSSPLKTNKQT